MSLSCLSVAEIEPCDVTDTVYKVTKKVQTQNYTAYIATMSTDSCGIISSDGVLLKYISEVKHVFESDKLTIVGP